MMSCGKNNIDDPIPIEEDPLLPIKITSLSKNFIHQNEELIIEGENFIQEKGATNVIINNQTYSVTPISNTRIKIEIKEEMGIEESTVSVSILTKESENKFFFILPNGWYQIKEYGSKDILKSYIFEESNTITSLVDVLSGGSYLGSVLQLETSEKGYQGSNKNVAGGNQIDLVMYNKDIGVSSNGSSGFFTTDGFDSTNSFGNFFSEGEIVIDTKILHVDESSCILTNRFGSHIYTNDAGLSSHYEASPDYLSVTDSTGGVSAHGSIKSIGQSTDGKFYELGFLYEQPYHAIILSSDSYNDWTMVEDKNPYIGYFAFAKFIDINNIVTLDFDDNMLVSTDLGANWTTLRANVSSFFLKNETTWYMVSDDQLFLTEDSGLSWNLELDLPTDSEVNHMSFSENKIVLSGNKGLLYVKHQ